MFGGTLVILRKGFAKVSDQTSQLDEVFNLERIKMIEVHDELPTGYSNDPVEPTYEISSLEIEGTEVYPAKEVLVVDKPEAEASVEPAVIEDKPAPVAKPTKTSKAK